MYTNDHFDITAYKVASSNDNYRILALLGKTIITTNKYNIVYGSRKTHINKNSCTGCTEERVRCEKTQALQASHPGTTSKLPDP